MKWISHTKYVDLETGEQIKQEEIKKGNYIKVKTKKHAEKANTTHGYVEYTTECRRNKQGKLGFS